MRVLQLGEPPSAANGVGEAIAREELAGLAYMFWGRLIVLGMLAAWAALTVPFDPGSRWVGTFGAAGGGQALDMILVRATRLKSPKT